MRYAVLVSVMFLVCADASAAGIEGNTFLFPVEPDMFRSSGTARYFNDLMQVDHSVAITGEHRVTQNSPLTVFEMAVQANGVYDSVFEGPATAGSCYDTRLHAVADPPGPFNRKEATWTGDQRCAPTQQGGGGSDPGDNTLPGDSCDGGTCYGSPIVIAINGGYEFTSVADGVWFDLDGDGRLDRVAWPRDGSVAFLFFDRNGNGIPDDGRELFGDHTFLLSGEQAEHGFEALAEFDSSGDGAVTVDDDRWMQLQLWRDFDHDGTAGTGEITPVAASGIAELGFDCRRVGRRDAHGNQLRWQAFAKLAHGRRPYYDVFLIHAPG